MAREDDLAKLRQKKRILKASLTRLEKFFDDIDPSNIDNHEVKVRLEKIEKTSKALTEVLLEISLLDSNITEIEIDKEIEEAEIKFFVQNQSRKE